VFALFMIIGGSIAAHAMAASQAATAHQATTVVSSPFVYTGTTQTKGTAATSASVPQGSQATLNQAAGDCSQVSSLSSTAPATCDGNAPADSTTQPSLNGYYGSLPGSGKSGFINLLPAFRWTGATGSLYVDLGTNPLDAGAIVGPSAISTLASMIFLISGYMWWFLLEVIKFGLTTDIITQAATSINSGFQAVTNALGSSGLIGLMILILAVVALQMVFRRRISHMVKLILGFLLPLAFLFSLSAAAAGQNGATPDSKVTTSNGTALPTGSPAWVALEGNDYVNQVVSAVNTGFSNIGPTSTYNLGTNTATADNSPPPTCNSYITTLYNQYAAYNNAANAGNAPGIADMGAVASISRLWQVAYLQYWQNAEFGEGEYATLPSCHVLEVNASISPGEQYQIMTLAYPAAITSGGNPYNYTDSSQPVPSNPGLAPLAMTGNPGKDYDVEVFGWAACEYINGAWQLRPGWTTINAASQGHGTTGSACSDWWSGAGGSTTAGGSTPGSAFSPTPIRAPATTSPGSVGTTPSVSGNNDNNQFKWNNLSDLTGAAGGIPQTNSGTNKEETAAQVTAAADVPYSFWGHNAGMRMLAGMMAGVTSVVYGWALGPMALGAALAQLGLVIMLILLPVALLFLAFPSDPQERSRGGIKSIGMRMLRITGGFFVAKFAILLAITLLIAMIAVLDNAVSGFQGTGTFLQMFIPIGCLMILRMLLKKMGMGNITSLSGALALPTAGAMAVAGERGMSAKVQATASKLGDKTGINRFDRFGKKVARSPVTAAKKSAELGKKGAKLGVKLGTDVAIGAATGGSGLLASQAKGALLKGAAKNALGRDKTPAQRLQALNAASSMANAGKDTLGKVPLYAGIAAGGQALGALIRFQNARLDAEDMPSVGKYKASTATNGPSVDRVAAAALGEYVIPTTFGTPRPISLGDAASAVNVSTQNGSQVFSIAPQQLSVWQDTSSASPDSRIFDRIASSLGDASDTLASSARMGQSAALALAGAASDQRGAASTTSSTALAMAAAALSSSDAASSQGRAARETGDAARDTERAAHSLERAADSTWGSSRR
jgi:hypothetical protein